MMNYFGELTLELEYYLITASSFQVWVHEHFHTIYKNCRFVISLIPDFKLNPFQFTIRTFFGLILIVFNFLFLQFYQISNMES